MLHLIDYNQKFWQIVMMIYSSINTCSIATFHLFTQIQNILRCFIFSEEIHRDTFAFKFNVIHNKLFFDFL